MNVYVFELKNSELILKDTQVQAKIEYQFGISEDESFVMLGQGNTEQEAKHSLTIFLTSKTEHDCAMKFYDFWDLRDDFESALDILKGQYPEYAI